MAVSARASFGLLTKVALSPPSLASSFLCSSYLAFAPPVDDKRAARTTQAMVLFNGILWLQRTYYFRYTKTRGPSDEEEERRSVNRIVTAASTAWNIFTSPPSKGIGSAGKQRTAADITAANGQGPEHPIRAECIRQKRFISNPPEESNFSRLPPDNG